MTYNFELSKVSKMSNLRQFILKRIHSAVSKTIIKKVFFVHSIIMLNPSLKDLNPSSEKLKDITKLLSEKKVSKAIKACLKIDY